MDAFEPHEVQVPLQQGPRPIAVGCICPIGRDHHHDEMGPA